MRRNNLQRTETQGHFVLDRHERMDVWTALYVLMNMILARMASDDGFALRILPFSKA